MAQAFEIKFRALSSGVGFLESCLVFRTWVLCCRRQGAYGSEGGNSGKSPVFAGCHVVLQQELQGDDKSAVKASTIAGSGKDRGNRISGLVLSGFSGSKKSRRDSRSQDPKKLRPRPPSLSLLGRILPPPSSTRGHCNNMGRSKCLLVSLPCRARSAWSVGVCFPDPRARGYLMLKSRIHIPTKNTPKTHSEHDAFFV